MLSAAKPQDCDIGWRGRSQGRVVLLVEIGSLLAGSLRKKKTCFHALEQTAHGISSEQDPSPACQ